VRSRAPEAGWTALLAYLSRDGTDPSTAYEAIRRRLLVFFRCRGVANGEDLADEAFDRVARRLLDGVVEAPPRPYFLGVARNLVRESWRRPGDRSLDDVDAPAPAPRPPRPALDCLEESLSRLSPSDREALAAYYTGAGAEKIEGRRRLAMDEGTSLSALRMRMCRLRERLEGEVVECLRRRERDGSPPPGMGEWKH
jgi:DNA-directed RNA polymerase specialized sigma24 family protein